MSVSRTSGPLKGFSYGEDIAVACAQQAASTLSVEPFDPSRYPQGYAYDLVRVAPGSYFYETGYGVGYYTDEECHRALEDAIGVDMATSAKEKALLTDKVLRLTADAYLQAKGIVKS